MSAVGNASLRMAALVTICEANSAGSTTGKDYNAIWHLFFDQESIDPGNFDERLLDWINTKLAASYDNLPNAMQAYAEDEGAANWDSLDTVTAIVP